MTITIDAPGLAKVSARDLLRELTNQRSRVKLRLRRAKAKLAGVLALNEDLKPYLQPGDYEHIKERLEREVKRRQQEEEELAVRVRKETHRQKISGEYHYRPPSWGR